MVETVFTDLLGETMQQLAYLQEDYYSKYQYGQTQQTADFNLEQWGLQAINLILKMYPHERAASLFHDIGTTMGFEYLPQPSPKIDIDETPMVFEDTKAEQIF